MITTHDFDLAVQMADELWLIRQDGALVSGSPEELAEQGAFDALFSHHALQFNRESRRFDLRVG